MHILSTEEINNVCIEIKRRMDREYPIYSTHIELMFFYGLRVSETLLIDDLMMSDDNRLIVKMPKTGYSRVIDSDSYLRYFDLQELKFCNSLSFMNKRAIERAVKECVPYAALRCGSKGINTHIFRHNFAKQQYEKLQSIQAVNQLLQEKTLSVCENYITKKIYY